MEEELLIDKIFKALSDQNRRKIIEVLKNNPGINVNELCTYFVISRFTVMKHVNVLEDASIILSEKDVTSRLMYLDTKAIQLINTKWIKKILQ